MTGLVPQLPLPDEVRESRVLPRRLAGSSSTRKSKQQDVRYIDIHEDDIRRGSVRIVVTSQPPPGRKLNRSDGERRAPVGRAEAEACGFDRGADLERR